MKFKVIQAEEKSEPVTTLKLLSDGNDVDVIATDAEGAEHCVVSFLSNGKLFKYGMDSSIGFKTNKSGQIVCC